MSIRSTLKRIVNGRQWIKEQSQEDRDAALFKAAAKRQRKFLRDWKNAGKMNSTRYQTKED